MRSLVTALLFSLLFTTSAVSAEVRLSVAASMTDVVKALMARYQEHFGEDPVLANFGSSGSLAKQIAQGAPADIFVSANPKWMDYLLAEQRIDPASVRTLAGNGLVLVGAKGLAVAGLNDLSKLQRIAIGSPKSVPAGQYAEQALRAAGIYGALATRLVLAKDVRQALMYADRGEVDGAFVYKTDALLTPHLAILLELPRELYDPVRYPVGLTPEGSQNPTAVAFFQFLQRPEAAAILQQYGFLVDRDRATP